MIIASFSFEVRSDKRQEFVSALSQSVQAVRWSAGCLGCRLLTDCENPNAFLLMSEWDTSAFLNRYLASPHFQVLEGMRFLLRDGPALSVDQVVSRGRPRGPVKHAQLD
jgi:quinol monooxygenase YgiN